MPKRKYDSEDEDIEQSEEEEVVARPKKPKKKVPAKKRKPDSDDEQAAKKGKKAKKAAGSDEEAVEHSTVDVDGVRFNSMGEESWIDIGNKKRLTVRKFKGKLYVDIREFYEDKETGDKRPGKKGVSLAVDEWFEVRRVADAVDRLLSRE